MTLDDVRRELEERAGLPSETSDTNTALSLAMDEEVKDDEAAPRLTGEFQHHTVLFEYPAPELLPHGKQPYLEMPKGVPDREEPESSRYRLGLSTGDLDFFFRMPTIYTTRNGDAVQAKLAGAEQQPLNLMAAIEQLSIWPGMSELALVSYINDSDIITVCRLKTVLYTCVGKVHCPVQHFELESADVAKMIRTQSREHGWVRLLDDLIHAKSDRAYLCRATKLADWDDDWLRKDEAQWPKAWDVNDLYPAREVFADRLTAVSRAPDGSIIREELLATAKLPEHNFDVEMPCGHYCKVSKGSITKMTVREVILATCPECDDRILTRDNIRHVAYVCDRIVRYAWDDKLEAWAPKCRKVRNSSSVVEVSAEALCASLEGALETFRLPTSINPRLLCPTQYPETPVLLSSMRDMLRAHTQIPASTPKKLLHDLEDLAWTLLDETVAGEAVLSAVLPPGYKDFVRRWMTRAVNDAVGTQADEEADEGMMAVLEKMGRAKIDPKAVNDGDVDDLLQQIGQTSLGATMVEDDDQEL